jgi:flagellar export protein FliJ
MKRFVWRLQHVLDIKTKEEQAKRAELFQLTEKLAETRGKLLMRKRILQDIAAGIAKKEPQKRLHEQQLFLKFSTTNDELIKKLQSEICELESQQRKKITEALKARRFKEGLEKLRTEAREQYITEQEKLEQKTLDEVATVFSARPNNRNPE